MDVGGLVASVLEDLSGELEPSAVTACDLPTVLADAVQLRIVVQNLLGNAAKHGCSGLVEVRGVRGPATWTLEVIDHGPGVAAGDRERIFEPLERLDHEVPGSGMGLTTCRRIIDAHGGTIELSDTPGGGTTVQITVPWTF